MKQESLREISELERQLVEVEDTRSKEVLVAPVDSVIFGLVPSSPGYAATAGETLVKVVPGGVLEAKVFITNRDVGFLGQQPPAQVRVDAFPAHQFGSLPGLLKSVEARFLWSLMLKIPSHVSLPPHPELQRETLGKGDPYPVSAGQSVQANLVLH